VEFKETLLFPVMRAKINDEDFLDAGRDESQTIHGIVGNCKREGRTVFHFEDEEEEIG